MKTQFRHRIVTPQPAVSGSVLAAPLMTSPKLILRPRLTLQAMVTSSSDRGRLHGPRVPGRSLPYVQVVATSPQLVASA